MKKKSRNSKSKHGKSVDQNNNDRNVLYNYTITNYDPFICGQPLFLIKKPDFIRKLELEYGINKDKEYMPKCRG